MKLLLGIGALVFLLSMTAIEVLSKKETTTTQIPMDTYRSTASEVSIPEQNLPQ